MNVMIYDYIDASILVFDNMYAKRLKAYKHIRYKIFDENPSEKQTVNTMFDSDTYGSPCFFYRGGEGGWLRDQETISERECRSVF